MPVLEIQTYGDLLVSGRLKYTLSRHIHVFTTFYALQITNWKAGPIHGHVIKF